MEIKNIITYLIITLFFTTLISGANYKENSQFNYLDLYIDQNSQTNKVSYEIKFEENQDFQFEMQTYYNNEKINKTCSHQSNAMSKTITCEIPKLGNGEYKFIATMTNYNGQITKTLQNTQYIYQNTQTNINFKEIDNNNTEITISITGESTDLKVNQLIPKEVIAELTPENKDSLITTTTFYQIIESDPLISWNIEKSPANITYTINKKISLEDRQKFKVEITQNTPFKIIKVIITLLIIVIILLIFRPLFKKNGKKDK